MYKRNTKILLGLLIISCFVCFNACNKIENCTITFDYNIGNLIYSMEQQQVQISKNDIINCYPNNGIEQKVIEGYHIEGWYTALTDNEGNVLIDSNRFVKLDKKWNFAVDKATEDITLFANWVKNQPSEPDTYNLYLDYNLGNLMKGTYMWFEGRNLRIEKNTTIYDNDMPESFPNDFLECYKCNGREYVVEGWYTPLLDDFGEIMKDENGFVILDKKWDLQNDIIESNMNTKTTCLYAKLIIQE